MSLCSSCKLKDEQLKVTYRKGKLPILVVGESPKSTLEEIFLDISKFATLRKLDQELKSIGIEFADCSFTEVIRCKLEDRKDFKEVASQCLPYFEIALEDISPKLIISFGISPLESLSSYFDGKYKIGEISKIKNIKYLPLYHPSPINPHGHKRNLDILKDIDLEWQKL